MLVLPYIRLLWGRWVAGRGSTQRSHLVTAPRKALTLAPISGRAVFREGTRRDRGPPPAGRTAQQPPPPAGREPRTNPHRRRGGGGRAGGRRREGGCAWPQQPSEGNSPNGAAPDCFLANMRPPPATAPQSGERRARRRPASGQGPDLAQLQHLPLLLSERGRGTSDAGRELGRAPRGRGGSRRECAAPGPAAPPSAASAAPPARLGGLRGLRGLGAPPDSGRRRRRRRPGSESSRRRARRSARPAAAAGASLGPPPCGAPRAARATCAAAAAAAAEGEAPPAARGSLSLHLCLGGRLGRQASEEASAPPPKPALGAEHAQCRRESAALRRAHSTSPGFRGSSSRREGRRPRVGRGPSILGNARPGLEMGGCLGTRGKLEGTWEGLEPWVGPVLKGPVSSFTCKMLTLYCDGADVSLQTKGQGWRGSRIAGVCLGGGGQAECACFWMEVDALKSCGSRAKKAGHPSAVFPHRLSNLTVSSSAYIKHAFRGWRDILVKQNPSGFESGMYVNFWQERPLSSLELE